MLRTDLSFTGRSVGGSVNGIAKYPGYALGGLQIAARPGTAPTLYSRELL